MQYSLLTFPDAVVIWCIYAKMLLDMALASPDANALRRPDTNSRVARVFNRHWLI